jgi:anti-repressor protein
MNELIRIENGEIKLDSRMIAEHFDKAHSDVLKDIRDEILKLESAGLGEGIFSLSSYTSQQNKELPCYEMTEEGALQLAARYDAVARRKLIIKIKELKERSIRRDSYMIEDPIERAKVWIGEQEQKRLLERKIETDKPKVLFADAVSTSKTSILIGELAKLLRQNGIEVGQNRLFEELRSRGYLIKRAGSDWNMPTQKSMELGLFEIKEHTHIDGNGCNVTTKTPKVTGKGQQYFINKFLAC